MASNEAFKKQAEGASAAAKKYMEDNELLQEVTITTTFHSGVMLWFYYSFFYNFFNMRVLYSRYFIGLKDKYNGAN